MGRVWLDGVQQALPIIALGGFAGDPCCHEMPAKPATATDFSTILTAPMTHLEAHSPQPLHRSMSCSTAVFFHALVSNENSWNSHAEIHLPQPEHRVRSIWAISVAIGDISDCWFHRNGSRLTMFCTLSCVNPAPHQGQLRNL
jgi:hypothetical protein